MTQQYGLGRTMQVAQGLMSLKEQADQARQNRELAQAEQQMLGAETDIAQQKRLQKLQELQAKRELELYQGLSQLPYEQRQQAIANQADRYAQFGINLGQITPEDLTDQSLSQGIATLSPLAGVGVPQQELSAFAKDLQAAGMQPGTPEFKEAVEDRYSKGQAAGLTALRTLINPDTGKPEEAIIDLRSQEVKFLGVSPAKDAPTGFDRIGEFESPEEARQLLSGANSQQLANAGYAMRLGESNNQLSEIESRIDPTSRAIRAALTPSGDGFIGFFGSMTDEAAKRMLTPEEQVYVSQATEFVRAALRKESGAVIGADEASEEIKKYFPMPGDSPEVIESKSTLRNRKIRELALQSGGAFEANMYLTMQTPDGQVEVQTEEVQEVQQPQGMAPDAVDAFIMEQLSK